MTPIAFTKQIHNLPHYTADIEAVDTGGGMRAVATICKKEEQAPFDLVEYDSAMLTLQKSILDMTAAYGIASGSVAFVMDLADFHPEVRTVQTQSPAFLGLLEILTTIRGIYFYSTTSSYSESALIQSFASAIPQGGEKLHFGFMSEADAIRAAKKV